MTDRGYGRISLDTTRSGSIAKQRKRIEAYAGTGLEWYADESVSGSKIPFWERPEGRRLLADLRQGDRVLVTKIDRAARNVRDLLTLVETIEAKDASIVFVDQNIDTSGPMGRFILTLLGAIAELEAAIIGERRTESLEAFREEGRHAVGKAPFGFCSVESSNGRGLVIVPEWTVAEGYDLSPADMVLEAVRRVMAGESQEKVRKSLDERASVSAVERYEAAMEAYEVGDRKQPRPLFTEMSKTGFHALLHNPRLAGMTPDGDGVVVVDGAPRIDPEAALLTPTQWRELQKKLDKGATKTWSRRISYGGALHCGVCGERMYVNVAKKANLTTGATHDTYTCRRELHEPGQGAPSIMVHRADTYLEEAFLEQYGERKAVLGVWSDSTSARDDSISIAELRLAEAQRRFEAALSDEEEDEALAFLRDAKRALRDAQAIPGERVFRVEETGQTVAEVWAEAGPEERTKMLRMAGRWVLSSGRAAPSERITLEPDDLLMELATHQPGSASEMHDDRGGFLLPS